MLADIILYSYESDCIQGQLRDQEKLPKSFNLTSSTYTTFYYWTCHNFMTLLVASIQLTWGKGHYRQFEFSFISWYHLGYLQLGAAYPIGASEITLYFC